MFYSQVVPRVTTGETVLRCVHVGRKDSATQRQGGVTAPLVERDRPVDKVCIFVDSWAILGLFRGQRQINKSVTQLKLFLMYYHFYMDKMCPVKFDIFFCANNNAYNAFLQLLIDESY